MYELAVHSTPEKDQIEITVHIKHSSFYAFLADNLKKNPVFINVQQSRSFFKSYRVLIASYSSPDGYSAAVVINHRIQFILKELPYKKRFRIETLLIDQLMTWAESQYEEFYRNWMPLSGLR
ncbi:hypothetical protein ACFWGC_27015 [Cytobacillus pseudoceanisediminis]|uniref:hypothetical protein n=1 Tax=Cytobacillus pseudoceanisediminis TaxID=3051614 RepID=UPI003651E876